MKATNVVTLRLPADMKQRLERLAQTQGVSMNQLVNYLLNRDLTEMEVEASLESRLAKSSVATLKRKALSVLDRVPDRPVPEWDAVG